MARIGVLALQGDFTAHARVMAALSAEVVEVRRVADLSGLDGLVIPGGESTTLLNLMADEPWFDALKKFKDVGGAIMGTCAGAILLAKDVIGPKQKSLGLLDVTIERNAFGRQVESFETEIDAPKWGGTIAAVFIRAPRFGALGPGVETLATYRGEPVCVQEGRVLAMTFHPELTRATRIHEYFLMLAQSAALTGRFS
jgi:pyridoxal 5'-phosphate synthase pdxT subunit